MPISSQLRKTTHPPMAGAFVQVTANKSISVTYGGAYAAAPRRAKAADNTLCDVRIAPDEAGYTDRLFVVVDDEKAEDRYIIGKDLVKVGVSKQVAQMWIERYNTELCMNTMASVNGTADYPLGIYVPKAGEYQISNANANTNTNADVYLTFNGTAIWKLSSSTYTLSLPEGTTAEYGLRINVRKAPETLTGLDEAIVDAQGETRKVVINDQVFIIRGNKVYSVDGSLVK